MNKFEVAMMKCPICSTERKISVDSRSNIRNTFCIKCDRPVIWKRTRTIVAPEFPQVTK